MSLEELLSTDLSGKEIVIIGKPASGKTYIATLIAQRYGQHLISTDNYIDSGFEQSLYELIEDIKPRTVPIVVEGMLGYRLLRKGLQEPETQFQPQIVIEVEITTKRQQEIYHNQRDPKKLKYMQSFAKSCMTVYNEYHRLLESAEFKPVFITVENDY